MSARNCGCDPEANHVCDWHKSPGTSAVPPKFEPMSKAETLAFEMLAELRRAQASNPSPMHSLHEGYAVILEELDELKAEVWKNPRKHPDRNDLARKEAIQVAAMALRLLHDVL